MESHETSSPVDYRSNVDSSRPFRSVKEAVAVFGERFLTGEIMMIPPSPAQVVKPPRSNMISPRRDTFEVVSNEPIIQQQQPQQEEEERGGNEEEEEEGLHDGLKKLEAELEETKREVRILKERESETEFALASLNAELHKTMSRLAKAEAMEAKANAAAMRSSSTRRTDDFGVRGTREQDPDRVTGRQGNHFPTLAEILSIADDHQNTKKKKKKKKQEYYYGGGGGLNVVKKEKPIVPLVSDLFSWKKSPSDYNSTLHKLPYSSPHFFN